MTERFSLSKPVIARVNGFAFGGGFELALACDVIVAAEAAEFALPEAKLGLVPGAGGIFRLVRQAPFKIAMGYLMTGRRMPAEMALKLGLVNEVAPLVDLDAVVNAWTEDILRCSPLAVRAIKEAACKSVDLTLQDAFTAKYEWEERRRAGLDWKEGPLAFHEKRRPCWSDC
ncbi:MAG TPA: enoyl-CoA hydratase-related protein [Burkholderiaceae bacterium]|nr:enoyl-CoA hydratase-related protein [Burkholderiaceae bacterium]